MLPLSSILSHHHRMRPNQRLVNDNNEKIRRHSAWNFARSAVTTLSQATHEMRPEDFCVHGSSARGQSLVALRPCSRQIPSTRTRSDARGWVRSLTHKYFDERKNGEYVRRRDQLRLWTPQGIEKSYHHCATARR